MICTGGRHRLLAKILEPAGIGLRLRGHDGPRCRGRGDHGTSTGSSTSRRRPTRCSARDGCAGAGGGGAFEGGLARGGRDDDDAAPAAPLDLEPTSSCTRRPSTWAGTRTSRRGVVTVKEEELARRLAFCRTRRAQRSGPFESWLLLRGLKTLSLRLERQQSNARTIARFLDAHPAVRRVHYVGLPSHPGFETHARQSAGPGSVVSSRRAISRSPPHRRGV